MSIINYRCHYVNYRYIEELSLRVRPPKCDLWYYINCEKQNLNWTLPISSRSNPDQTHAPPLQLAPRPKWLRPKNTTRLRTTTASMPKMRRRKRWRRRWSCRCRSPRTGGGGGWWSSALSWYTSSRTASRTRSAYSTSNCGGISERAREPLRGWHPLWWARHSVWVSCHFMQIYDKFLFNEIKRDVKISVL